MQQPLYKMRGSDLVVEALCVDLDTVDTIVEWADGFKVEEKNAITHEMTPGVNIATINGNQRASQGAYVLKFNQSFYVLNNEAFNALYEHQEK